MKKIIILLSLSVSLLQCGDDKNTIVTFVLPIKGGGIEYRVDLNKVYSVLEIKPLIDLIEANRANGTTPTVLTVCPVSGPDDAIRVFEAEEFRSHANARVGMYHTMWAFYDSSGNKLPIPEASMSLLELYQQINHHSDIELCCPFTNQALSLRYARDFLIIPHGDGYEAVCLDDQESNVLEQFLIQNNECARSVSSSSTTTPEELAKLVLQKKESLKNNFLIDLSCQMVQGSLNAAKHLYDLWCTATGNNNGFQSGDIKDFGFLQNVLKDPKQAEIFLLDRISACLGSPKLEFVVALAELYNDQRRYGLIQPLLDKCLLSDGQDPDTQRLYKELSCKSLLVNGNYLGAHRLYKNMGCENAKMKNLLQYYGAEIQQDMLYSAQQLMEVGKLDEAELLLNEGLSRNYGLLYRYYSELVFIKQKRGEHVSNEELEKAINNRNYKCNRQIREELKRRYSDCSEKKNMLAALEIGAILYEGENGNPLKLLKNIDDPLLRQKVGCLISGCNADRLGVNQTPRPKKRRCLSPEESDALIEESRLISGYNADID